MKSTSTAQSNSRRSTVETRAVRWEDLPHSRLHTEIRLAVLTRTPEEAFPETELQGLKDDLPKLESEDHRKYLSLTIGEMKRELRIWRDYYLKNLNRASHTERRRAIGLAVAPVAAVLLARRASKYIVDSDVDPAVFSLIVQNPFPLVLVSLDDSIESGPLPPPPDMSIEDIMTKVVPKSSFSNVRKKGGFLSGGPFALPALPRPTGATLYASQPVWLPSLCRMWDEVLCEVMTQNFLIDLDERVSAFRADESLNEFQRIAGTLYLDYRARYKTPRLPPEAWNQLAEVMDQKSLPLKENLESLGKKSLAAAIVECGHEIDTWVQALAFRATHDPAARIVPGIDEKTDRYLGDLTQHAKKAIHRATEAVEKTRKEHNHAGSGQAGGF